MVYGGITMRKLCFLVLLILSATSVTNAAEVIREYKFPNTDTFVGTANSQIALAGLRVKVSSAEVTQRVVGGLTSSLYTTMSLTCSDGRTIPVGIIFSSRSADRLLPESVIRKQFTDEGLHSVDTTEHGMAFVMGTPKARDRITASLAKYVVGACGADRETIRNIGYNISVSLWLSDGEERYNFGLKRVDPEEFEKLK
jgi:hypothetical protein